MLGNIQFFVFFDEQTLKIHYSLIKEKKKIIIPFELVKWCQLFFSYKKYSFMNLSIVQVA